MVTTLSKDFDFEIANTYCITRKKCNQIFWSYNNTAVKNYFIFNDNYANSISIGN